MSTNSTKSSITDASIALEYFVDRQYICRTFERYIHNEIPESKILFIHGEGGNGKSLLLRFLRDTYCHDLAASVNAHRLQYAKDLSSRANSSSQSKSTLPSAILDFAPLPGGNESHQIAFDGLVELRRKLSLFGVKFPRFDLAGILYLRSREGLSQERSKAIFGSEEVDAVGALVDTLLSTLQLIPFGALIANSAKVGVKHYGKKPQEDLYIWLQKRGLDSSTAEAIINMDPERQLVEALPKFFAEDLNAYMQKVDSPRRLVLLFDSHEALWGTQGRTNTYSDRHHLRDEWLRLLLLSLRREFGIVTVVAGRELPDWPSASFSTLVTDEIIEPIEIGPLDETSAEQYLVQTGIESAFTRSLLLEASRITNNQVHPLYLGLCVDIAKYLEGKESVFIPEVFHITRRGRNAGKEVVRRLLRYLNPETNFAVRALCACRAFNFDVYLALSQSLHFLGTRPEFDSLVSFSFVWKNLERDSSSFRVHELLRRLVLEDEGSTELVHQAHIALEAYYNERSANGDTYAISESLYHKIHIDREAGVQQWIALFNTALRLSKYDVCLQLMEVRSSLSNKFNEDLAIIINLEGEYYAALARYDDAVKAYSEAIQQFNTLLKQDPTTSSLSNLSLAYFSLASLLYKQGQKENAASVFGQAVKTIQSAVRRSPKSIPLLMNAVHIFSTYGALHTELRNYNAAQKLLEEAIEVSNNALEKDSTNIDLLNNKGLALSRLGESYAQQGEFGRAIKYYAFSLEVLNAALTNSVADLPVLANLALVYGGVASVQNKTSTATKEVAQTYQVAISIIEQAIEIAPNDPHLRLIAVETLSDLGTVYARRNLVKRARKVFQTARDHCTYALAIAPADTLINNHFVKLTKLLEKQ